MSLKPCRSPYCECTPGACTHPGCYDARGDAQTSSTKPSNPKDTVGIRKAPMSTVSAAVMAEVGVAMLEGAAKYGRHNYRAVGVRSSVYYDATMRHLMSWWEGEDIDPDTMDVDDAGVPVPGTGLSHITKAITSLVVLRDAMIQGMVEDDRAPRSMEFFKRLNKMAGEILDRHADKAPKHYTIADSKVESATDPAPCGAPNRRVWSWEELSERLSLEALPQTTDDDHDIYAMNANNNMVRQGSSLKPADSTAPPIT